jgi:predicted PurR-regulated permease PerM
MNKKFPISKTSIYLILLIVALIIYVFTYFIPVQSQINTLRTEIRLFDVETNIYRQYLEDPSPLEADIAAIQAEIDRMNAEDYTNDSTVSFDIGNAIQRYGVSLSSVSLSDATTFEGNRILPIYLELSGDWDNILKFIAYFETNQDGSYLVRESSFVIAANNVTAKLVIYLCTPNV